jgi:hypothetical protein
MGYNIEKAQSSRAPHSPTHHPLHLQVIVLTAAVARSAPALVLSALVIGVKHIGGVGLIAHKLRGGGDSEGQGTGR